MDRLERLEAIEAIRSLKARYFRLMDTKHWDELRSVFTADLKVLTPDGAVYAEGGDTYAAALRSSLEHAVSAHQGLAGEVEIDEDGTGRAIWAMQDIISWEDRHPKAGWKSIVGRGHYHETYRREGGTWRIATLTLTRLSLDITWPEGHVPIMTDLSFADYFGEGRDDNPYWNESVWFSFSIPERRIHGMIQYYFRPNMGMLNGGPCMWDASGTYQWNALYYNWSHLQGMPAGAQKFDMQARTSLKVKMLEPLTRYKIDYDKEGFEMDLVWEAIGPCHELKTGDASQQATAKFHIEQPGRMKGTIRRHGEAFPIDCFSMRDTSYGAREYESLALGGYFWGIAADSSFHALCMGAGREAKCVGGYIMKDGEMASLVSGQRKIVEYGQFGPSKVLFEGTDELGRSMRATGTIDPGLIFTGYTDHTVVWSLAEWDWDGVTHWGDNQEFAPGEWFRQMARGEIKLGE